MAAPDFERSCFVPRSSHAALRLLLLLPLALPALLITACGESPDESDAGPTIDVHPGIEVSTEDDVVEPRRDDQGLSGVLPGDFPTDVPLVLPASLVDFGDQGGGQGGRRYAEFATAKGRQSVEQGMIGLLSDRGWDFLAGSAEGSPDELRLTKDQRLLRIVFLESEAGSVYRIIY